MAEPHPSLVEDDVENTSDSSYDEEESDVSDESSSSDEESGSSESSSSSGEADEEEESSESDSADIWGSSGEEMETEEAAEAGLHADYLRALGLLAEHKYKEALFLMRSLLQHPLLQSYHVVLGNFDWKNAHVTAHGEKISSTAHIFSSLHFNISKLVRDPIPHLLQSLTVYPNDEFLWKRVGEAALKVSDWSTAILAFQKCSHDWIAIDGTVVALYMSHLYEECLQKLSEVLPSRPYYVVGRVIKESIRRSSSFWESRCAAIFENKWPSLKEHCLPPIDEKQYAKVLTDIGAWNKLNVEHDINKGLVNVVLAQCQSIADVGVVLCDAYDRLEWFGDFIYDRVCFVENEKSESDSNDEDIIHLIISNILDVICIVEELVDQVILAKKFAKKRPQTTLELEFSRRSARFHSDFEITDDTVENLSLSSLLDKACVLQNTITSLFSLVPSRKNSDEMLLSTAPILQETGDIVDSCKSSVCLYTNEETDIFTALRRYLVWIAERHWKRGFSACAYEAVIQSYRRWRSLTLGNNNYLGKASTGCVEEIKLNIILAECSLEEAILECYKCLSHVLSVEMTARIYWLLAHNGGSLFSSKVRRNYLLMLIKLMQKNTIDKFYCLIHDYEVISVKRAQSLIEQIDCRESVFKISHLFETQKYDKVINILENNFDWRETNREMALKTALIFIDSCLGAGDMNKAAVWIARILDQTRGTEGTDEALERLRLIDLDLVSLENISNIIHCIAPLLTEEAHYPDIELWIILYEGARRLEGEPTIEELNSRYSSDCVMPNSSLNILITAHDAVADTLGCHVNNYRFPLYALRELNRVRKLSSVSKILADGVHTDQLRAFQDEVHQCTSCLFGLPSRRKRQLEDHGGPHDYEPTEEDALFILPLFLPDRLPSYAGSVAPDLIEIVQKKFLFFLTPTEEEAKKVKLLDEFIHNASLDVLWPRCSTTTSLRAEVFYHMALNSYRSQRFTEALDLIKLFIVSLPLSEGANSAFNGWAMMAFAGTMVLFSAKEEELLESLKNEIFIFRLAFSLEHKEDFQLSFNFACALYQFRSKLRRFGSRLEMDDLRLHTVRRCMEGLLEESADLFLRSCSALEDGDPDKWECHYFLAKIYEKLGHPISQIMHHYYQAARQLEASGVQYPLRIKAKKQENVEAIELHYRAYACLIKWIIETGFSHWSREELLLMYSFAKCFQNHGVCRKEVGSNFDICPSVRFVVANSAFLASLAEKNIVEQCLDCTVERIDLSTQILALCKEAFQTCVQRFPHFKSYYRLAQLAICEKDLNKAANLLFDCLLFKKKANMNCDNVFENLVTITKQELDRGDALQYHAQRIATMALFIAKALRDINALITLVHTLSTLSFCQNYDYVVKRDLDVLYGCALNMLSECVIRKITTEEVDSKLLLDLFSLFQYAGRNKEVRLCRRLLPLMNRVAERTKEFPEGTDPIQYCKQITAAAKQQRLGKRRAKKIGFENMPSNKEPRLSADALTNSI